jgi:hypothetical protein
LSTKPRTKTDPRSLDAELTLLDTLVSNPQGLPLQEIRQGRNWLFNTVKGWKNQKDPLIDIERRRTGRSGRPAMIIKPNARTYEVWRERRQVEDRNIPFFIDLESSEDIPLSSLDLEGITLNADVAHNFTDHLIEYLGDLSIELVKASAITAPQAKITIALRTKERSQEIAVAAESLADIDNQIRVMYQHWNEDRYTVDHELSRRGEIYDSLEDYLWSFLTNVSQNSLLLFLGREVPFYAFAAQLAKELYVNARERLREMCIEHGRGPRNSRDVVTQLKNTTYRRYIEEFEQSYVKNPSISKWIQRHLDGRDDWFYWVPFGNFGFERTHRRPMYVQRGKVAFAFSQADYGSCLRALEESLDFEYPLWHTSERGADDLAWLQAWGTMRSRWTKIVRKDYPIMKRIRAALRNRSRKGWKRYSSSYSGECRLVTEEELNLTLLLLEYLEQYYQAVNKVGGPGSMNLISIYGALWEQLNVSIWQISELFEDIDDDMGKFDHGDGAIKPWLQRVDQLLTMLRNPKPEVEPLQSQPSLEQPQVQVKTEAKTRITHADEEKVIPPTDEQLETMVGLLNDTAFVLHELTENRKAQKDRITQLSEIAAA